MLMFSGFMLLSPNRGMGVSSALSSSTQLHAGVGSQCCGSGWDLKKYFRTVMLEQINVYPCDLLR